MNKSVAFLYLLLFTNFVFAQKEQALEGIDQEIEVLAKAYNAVGLSVAVIQNDHIIYSKGFGYRNIEAKLPVTSHTIFPIGSVTKAFTASLLGQLESEGEISLKAKPALYIPGLQFYNHQMNHFIKIEDLLSHRSGIGNQGTSLSLFPENDKLKTVQRLKYLKPEGEVLDSWHYSNMGYTLAGTIIEQVTNESWNSNIESKIFKPLNMVHSFTSLNAMQATNNFSIGYGRSNGKTESVLYENYYSYSPAGGIRSTVRDLCNWMSIWWNEGQFNEQQVLPKEYVKNATSIHNIRPQEGADKDVYLFGDGFGWRVESFYGHYKVHHGGNTSGFSSHLVMFPNEKFGVVILTNQHSSLLPYMISHLIASRMLNLPNPDVTAYPIVVGDIYQPNSEHKEVNIEKQPSHQLDNFTGSYWAKGYGTIEIINENQRLFAQFPTFKFQLEHLNFNTFFMKGIEAIPQIMDPEFTVQFIIDTHGDISTLKLYSQKEPIEFIRKKE